jgi:hypothetical protein
VEHLARKLREAGLEPFLDKWHLIPGEPWQEGMEEALRQSRTCTVFIGREVGPWQNEEMRAALAKRVRNRSFRVIPVLSVFTLEAPVYAVAVIPGCCVIVAGDGSGRIHFFDFVE